MIRFVNGTPDAIWYSQHASGQAFTYAAVEKKDKRPYVMCTLQSVRMRTMQFQGKSG